jgi:hypothetical protein
MHILLGLLGTIVTILFLLSRLAARVRAGLVPVQAKGTGA